MNNNDNPSTYEEIMGIQPSSSSMGDGSNMNGTTANNMDTTSDGGRGAVDALSKRLSEFRKWCTNEALMKIHPAICIVNGEATDGTKNAPVLAYARGASNATATPAQAAQGRVGMVDGIAERALYERTMGCQIWTAREIKKDEVMMTCPRSAMITPDLVAASDAGRAILACCANPGEGNRNFWDAFENTALCEAQITQKMATKPGAQLLVKTLRERDLAEKAFKAATTAKAPQEHELAKHGVISTRAPFLAFLIHQRFSPKTNPPTVTESNHDFEKVSAEDGNSNAISTAKRIRLLSDTPSTFGPYARTLPSSVSLPICWKRNELALLSGCIPGLQPLQETVATTTQLATEFTALLKAGILTRFPNIFSPGMISWERWVWAAAIFASRILPSSAYLDKGKDRAVFSSTEDNALQSPANVWNELGVLIPFLDMVNHEVDAACILWQKNVPDDMEVMDDDSEGPHPPRAVMTKRVKKQQQVYFSYGDDDSPNYKMLVQYGFAQMLNKADAARLGWGLMDAVGQVDPPADYTSLIRTAEKDKQFLVYESNDGQAINEWWSDDRLTLLETEAFPAVENSFMSSLKMGKKMTGSARSDGAYDPILLTASLVSTMPPADVENLMAKRKATENEKSPVTVSKRHQKVLRNYLLFIFTRKLEKLLENLSSGLKFHYGSLNLWTKASEGGIRYVPKETETEEDSRVGWQTFFDRHAYAATMEVEKHYYALAPDCCVLTLYDGHLQALQASIDGLLSVEKFEAGVLKQLEDLGFTILSGDDAMMSDKSSKNGKAAGNDDSCRKEDDGRKKEEGKSSPKKKNRNRKRNSNITATGERPPAIKLHIGNLSYQTTPSDLFDFFARGYGRDNVLECHIPAERNTGRSRGFGFVTLPEQIAQQILSSGRKCEINGRVLKIAESNSAGTNKPNRHPEAPPPVSNDRCSLCGYRPKYCVCPNGPSIPGLQTVSAPGYGRGPEYGRDYNHYGRDDRYRRERRSRSRSPYRRSRSERDDYDHYRDYSRDRDRDRRYYDDYDPSRSRSHSRDRERRRDTRRDRKDRRSSRDRSRDRSRERGDRSRDLARERSRERDRERSSRRSRSRSSRRSRSRSRERRDRRDRDRHGRRRSPSPFDVAVDSDGNGSVSKRAGGSPSPDAGGKANSGSDGRVEESRKRRSRSRERSRRSRKKKRRARSRSRSPSSSPDSSS